MRVRSGVSFHWRHRIAILLNNKNGCRTYCSRFVYPQYRIALCVHIQWNNRTIFTQFFFVITIIIEKLELRSFRTKDFLLSSWNLFQLIMVRWPSWVSDSWHMCTNILDGCVRYCRSTRTSRIGKSGKIQICLHEVNHCHHLKYKWTSYNCLLGKIATKFACGKYYCVALFMQCENLLQSKKCCAIQK